MSPPQHPRNAGPPAGRRRILLALIVAALAVAIRLRCRPGERATGAASTRVEMPRGTGEGAPSTAATAPAPAPVAAEPAGAATPGAPTPAGRAEDEREATRFEVRWQRGGLCRGEDAAAKMRDRALLLGSFEERAAGSLALHADPATPASAGEWILDEVRRPNRRFGQFFDEVPLPLTIYVYRDLEQLHRFACVNPAADAYYDGAIHVSAVPRDGSSLRNVVTHELVHHALTARGVTMPMWLHEGLAMYAADERWWQRPDLQLVRQAETQHLPFAAMARAFPDGADEAFARLAYFQSLAMVYAVAGGPHPGRELTAPIGADASRIRGLVDELSAGRVSPEEAFAWTLRASGEDEEGAWKATVGRIAALPALSRPR